jgi:2-polyprenyl-3-methyl-5-hydroxy-6-metoxy-1,4-benzoquinol methylase
VKKHEFGFFHRDPLPTPHQLAEFYKSHYFDGHNFEKKYDDEEYFHKFLHCRESEFIFNQYNLSSQQFKKFRLLDVGCGEGFSLSYFEKQGWEVYGTDYSKMGIERQFPQFISKVTFGDTDEVLQDFINKNFKFDLIILNNVLEHLLYPIETMKKLKTLISEKGVVKVQVPNDFSLLQKTALSLNYIDKEFWTDIYEHINFFNKESLTKTFLETGFTKVDVLGDYPIDFNLMNPDSNYIKDKSKGRNCHIERIRIENMLARNSIEDLVSFRRGCGQAGLGRNIIVYGKV